MLFSEKNDFIEIPASEFKNLCGDVDYVARDELEVFRKSVFEYHPDVAIPHMIVSKFLVTRKMYCDVIKKSNIINIFNLDPEPSTWKEVNPPKGENPDLIAVENVNWYDCILFCNVLSQLQFGETSGYYELNNIKVDDGHIVSAEVQKSNKGGYRLLTEQEWEFCARGGSPHKVEWKYPVAGCIPENMIHTSTYFDRAVSEYAWYNNDSKPSTIANRILRRFQRYRLLLRRSLHLFNIRECDGPHEVGLKKANSLGLFDMSGNVFEWVWDEWDGSFRRDKIGEDISIPFVDGSRCMRGGGWPVRPFSILVTSRYAMQPQYCASLYEKTPIITANGSSDVGFRICRDV